VVKQSRWRPKSKSRVGNEDGNDGVGETETVEATQLRAKFQTMERLLQRRVR